MNKDTPLDFSSYLKEMEAYCPFIKPSQNVGKIRNEYVYIMERERTLIESEIFWSGVKFTENFRENRRGLTSAEKLLLNTNLIFSFASANSEPVLDWPHFLLKNIYSKVGIVFGKFHRNTEVHDKVNSSLPSPPYSHLSIRSAVKKKDTRFFNKAPYLLNIMLESEDENESHIGFPSYVDSNINIDQMNKEEREKTYLLIRKWGKEILDANKH